MASDRYLNVRKNLFDMEIDSQRTLEQPSLPGVHFTSPPQLTVSDLLAIINQETPDEFINDIVRTLLGWKQRQDHSWDNSNAHPAWLKAYPDHPPDFIGRNNDYSPEHDRPVKLAVQRLIHTTKMENRQLLKEVLKPHGFRGWKVTELTPNRTRRATVVNWILQWYRVHYPQYEWK